MSGKELAKQESSVPAVANHQGAEEILHGDILIPRLYLMQGLSDLVTDGKAQIGQFIKSTTEECIGDMNTPFRFIPLTFRNRWREEERVGDKFEYRGTMERNAANEQLPWSFQQDGREWKRTKVIEVFGLLPSEIEAEQKLIAEMADSGEIPDLGDNVMPVLIAFRSSSFRAGQVVTTHFANARDVSHKLNRTINPYDYVLEIVSKKEEKDGNKYYVPVVKVLPQKEAKVEGVVKECVYKWADFMRNTADSVLSELADDKRENDENAAPTKDVAGGAVPGEGRF